MSWKTVSRIKKTKLFTSKGNVYLPNMSNGVGWINSNVSTFLTSVSKVGGGLTHEAITSKSNDNSYNIYTNKTTFSQVQSSYYVMREYLKESGKSSPTVNIIQDYYSGGTTSYIVGTLFVEFGNLYYTGTGWSDFPAFDMSFDLYIGGTYQGKYHRHHSGGGSGGGHQMLSYPYNTIFGNTADDMSRSGAVICNINMTSVYGNGNIELRNFSLTYNTGGRDFILLDCDYKIILYNYICDKLSTTTSDSQCLSVAYEIN